ncbi:MAG: hypothetical protein ACRETD_08455 [Steroidobacteraceae bacterium]
MNRLVLGFALAGCTLMTAPAFAADTCSGVSGNAILSARTPQVDLYDGPTGKRIKTLDADKFPKCLAVSQKAPNGMLQVTIDGQVGWVPPNMVNARVAGTSKPVCRNLAMGGDDTKVGSTRALGEGCGDAGGNK